MSNEPLISVTILVPAKDVVINDLELKVDSGERHYPPTMDINSDNTYIEVPNLPYEIEDYDEGAVINLAKERYARQMYEV